MTVKEPKEKLEQFDGALFVDDYAKKECATCIYYDTDRKDQPCCSCINWENWEKNSFN